MPGDVGPHVLSVGYLALTRESEESAEALARAGALWRQWYDFFPWEDWRHGRPAILDATILPALSRWVGAEGTPRSPPRALGREERARLAFGPTGSGADWDEERVLDRYELLYEAGLVLEAARDGRRSADAAITRRTGEPMRFDHRRIVATAISRPAAKL